MLRVEEAFTNKISNLLKKEGYCVKKEVRISRGFRPDIRAIKDEIVYAIEVKVKPRGVMDDISKAYQLLQLPEPDEVYVAAPEDLIIEDHIAFAKRTGVGLLTVSGSKLVWLVSSRQLKPPKLSASGGVTGEEHFAGETFEIHRNVMNRGQKIAKGLLAYCTPAGPFAFAPKTPRIYRKAFLEPDEDWSVEFKIRVRKKARPGGYPLMTVITAENADRSDMLFEVRVASHA
jgi:hypothetical protein